MAADESLLLNCSILNNTFEQSCVLPAWEHEVLAEGCHPYNWSACQTLKDYDSRMCPVYNCGEIVNPVYKYLGSAGPEGARLQKRLRESGHIWQDIVKQLPDKSSSVELEGSINKIVPTTSATTPTPVAGSEKGILSSTPLLPDTALKDCVTGTEFVTEIGTETVTEIEKSLITATITEVKPTFITSEVTETVTEIEKSLITATITEVKPTFITSEVTETVTEIQKSLITDTITKSAFITNEVFLAPETRTVFLTSQASAVDCVTNTKTVTEIDKFLATTVTITEIKPTFVTNEVFLKPETRTILLTSEASTETLTVTHTDIKTEAVHAPVKTLTITETGTVQTVVSTKEIVQPTTCSHQTPPQLSTMAPGLEKGSATSAAGGFASVVLLPLLMHNVSLALADSVTCPDGRVCYTNFYRVDNCKVYNTTPHENCHAPCELGGCPYHYSSNRFCTVYSCTSPAPPGPTPPPGPAPKPAQNGFHFWNFLIGGVVIVAILGIAARVLLKGYWMRRFRNAMGGEEGTPIVNFDRRNNRVSIPNPNFEEESTV